MRGNEMDESLEQQAERLGRWIIENVPGEPSRPAGAIDTAIAIMRMFYPPTATDIEAVQGAVARGWCSPENEQKEMDSDLALAIADQVLPLVTAANSRSEQLASKVFSVLHDGAYETHIERMRAIEEVVQPVVQGMLDREGSPA